MRNPLCSSTIVCCAILLLAQSVVSGQDRKNSQRPVVQSKSTAQPVEIRDFEIRVDNKPAGTHRLTIKSLGEADQVSIQSDVKMDFVVYAYVFKFRGVETWRNGHVEQVDIRCEDGGKKRSYLMKSQGDVQQVSFNGKAVPPGGTGIMSTAYWQLPPADLRTKRFAILDVDHGPTCEAAFKEVEADTVTVAGRARSCVHFKIDGPSPADLWFDEQNRLVRQKSVEMGHQTELRLKEIRVSQDEN